jgi:hypothetical protein
MTLSQLQEASEGHYAVKAACCLLHLGWIVSAFLYLGCWIVSLCTHGLVLHVDILFEALLRSPLRFKLIPIRDSDRT